MCDRPSASGGTNAAIIAITLLFAACSEHEFAATARPPPQQGDNPVPPNVEAPARNATPSAVERLPDVGETGIASWYGAQYHGKRTASGAVFDMHAMTAAHPTLPLGTMVLVENLANGRAAAVRITDRGPYIEGRIIDLSLAAALQLGLKGDGTAPVRIRVIARAPTPPTAVATTR